MTKMIIILVFSVVDDGGVGGGDNNAVLDGCSTATRLHCIGWDVSPGGVGYSSNIFSIVP